MLNVKGSAAISRILSVISVKLANLFLESFFKLDTVIQAVQIDQDELSSIMSKAVLNLICKVFCSFP